MTLLLVVTACRGDELPAAVDESTTTGSPDECAASNDCTDAVCVASWDAGADMRTPAACVSACVVADDLARFCIDDAACCEGLVCNEADGLCAVPSDDTSTGSSESSSSESSSSESSSSESSSSESSSSESTTSGGEQ